MKKLIIIPTYEEASNIKSLLQRIKGLGIKELSILVVDDSPTQDTIRAVDEISKGEGNIFFKKRTRKEGIASAYIEGFKYALANGYDLIVQMDADLSHEPEKLKELLKASDRYDFIVGSRYISGGGVKNWNVVRRAISLVGNYGSKKFLSLPINDLTSGFNVWRSRVLTAMNFDDIKSKGYFFQIEIKYLAVKKGFSFQEEPIIFKERKQGSSKFRLGIIIEAIQQLINIKTKK
jgi:dolichol-phosphate mannosyltransferase